MTLVRRSKVKKRIKGKDAKPDILLWHLLYHRIFWMYAEIHGSPDVGNGSEKISTFVGQSFHGPQVCYKPPSTRLWYRLSSEEDAIDSVRNFRFFIGQNGLDLMIRPERDLNPCPELDRLG